MPAALPAIAIAASVGSAVMGAVGAISSGNAQKSAADYQAQVAANNAKIATQNAQYATAAGNAQASAKQLGEAQQMGAIKAAQASSGVDVSSGSPLDIRTSQQTVGNLDVLTIRNNAARQAYGYQVGATSDMAQSQLDTMQGQAAQTAGTIGGISSILGGASSVGSKYLDWTKVAGNTPQGVSV